MKPKESKNADYHARSASTKPIQNGSERKPIELSEICADRVGLGMGREQIKQWDSQRIELSLFQRAFKYRLHVAIALAILIFVADTLSRHATAVAVMYVLCLIVASDSASRITVKLVSGGCAVLTLLSFFISHGLATETLPTLRLIFSLFANVTTAILLTKQAGDRLILQAQARLLELTSDAIFLRDGTGRIYYWNHGAERLFGYQASEVLGKFHWEVLAVQGGEGRAEAERCLVETGSWEGELEVTTKSGRSINVYSRWRAEQPRPEAPLMIIVTTIDISARKAADAALRASEFRYRTIFETLPVAIWEHDLRPVKAKIDAVKASGVVDFKSFLDNNPDFIVRARKMVRITDVNQTALRLMGISEKSDFFEYLSDFLPEDDESFGQFLAALSEGQQVFQSETSIRSSLNGQIPVIVTLNLPPANEELHRVQASIIDISNRVTMEEALEKSRLELEQASRFAMVGEISASIAHEVNQPLAAIMSSTQAAQLWLDHDPPNLHEAKLALADAIQSTTRASQVVKRVRILLGKAKSETSELSIDDIVTHTVRLKQKELDQAGVRLTLALGSHDLTIQGDKILLQQVLLNLIENAVHAMETTRREERSLAIRTEIESNEIRVRIIDTGEGVGDLVSEAIFKAFATTKPAGMGLGLAISKSIIAAHKGSISIANRPDGRGAIVEFRIPVPVLMPFGSQ